MATTRETVIRMYNLKFNIGIVRVRLVAWRCDASVMLFWWHCWLVIPENLKISIIPENKYCVDQGKAEAWGRWQDRILRTGSSLSNDLVNNKTKLWHALMWHQAQTLTHATLGTSNK